MSLPKSISPDPIHEATFEMRFDASVPDDAVFGFIFGVVREHYGDVEQLPILQLPLAVRSADPNLAYLTHYRAKRENFVLGIGPKVLAVAAVKPYVGWDSFSAEIINVIEGVASLNIIKDVPRIGLRYINSFEGQIIDRIDFEAKIKGVSVQSKETMFRTLFEESIGSIILNISSGVTIKNTGVPDYLGSIIDIDVVHEKTANNILTGADLLSEMHETEKRHFFNLLSEEFLSEYEVKY